MQGLPERCFVPLDALKILWVTFMEVGEQVEADAVQVCFQLCSRFHSGLLLLQGVINGGVQVTGQAPGCNAYDQCSEQQQAIGERQLQSEAHFISIAVALFISPTAQVVRL